MTETRAAYKVKAEQQAVKAARKQALKDAGAYILQARTALHYNDLAAMTAYIAGARAMLDRAEGRGDNA